MVNKSLSELKTEDRVSHLLEEVRIVIPGTQVFFGFQLIVVFQESFRGMETYLKDLHLASLLAIALAIVFLLAPSSYDRIIEDRGNVRDLTCFARRMIFLALTLLAFGSALDLFVIISHMGIPHSHAVVLSGGIFLFSLVLWFLFPFYQRKK